MGLMKKTKAYAPKVRQMLKIRAETNIHFGGGDVYDAYCKNAKTITDTAMGLLTPFGAGAGTNVKMIDAQQNAYIKLMGAAKLFDAAANAEGRLSICQYVKARAAAMMCPEKGILTLSKVFVMKAIKESV